MCYSALIKAELKDLEKLFGVKIDWSSFEEAYNIRSQYQYAQIPSGLDSYIIQNAETPLQKRLAKMAKAHYKEEIEKTTIKLKKFEQDVKDFEEKIKKGSKAKDLDEKLRKRRETVQKQKDKIESCKNIEESGVPRIFPNYYAPVIVSDVKDKSIRLMRYHICPKNGTELNTFKYNLFNARKDRLIESKMWKPIFGKQHAIFPFLRFYENVEGEDGKSKTIYFTPKDQEIMWSAAIFEEAKLKEGLLRSFAAITDEPPPEVSAAGHDRCPIFLAEENFDLWLDPKNMTQEELVILLSSVVPTYFEHKAA